MSKPMMLRTKIFDICFRRYQSLSELAQAMGISVSQVYRVREGKRSINQSFIIGAARAFPGYKLDDLFRVVPESLPENVLRTNVNKRHSYLVQEYSRLSLRQEPGEREIRVKARDVPEERKVALRQA